MYLRAEMLPMSWTIIDTDFVVSHENLSVWGAIIIEYEKRNLDVVKNLLIAIKTWPSNAPKEQIFSEILRHDLNLIEPYIDELEKYMMLL
jgi:hypothetical protein